MEEQQKTVIDVNRRKRIERYKRIILLVVVAMILLPTILCILLFIKVNSLQKQINDLTDKKIEIDLNDKEDTQEPSKDNISVGLESNEMIDKYTDNVYYDDQTEENTTGEKEIEEETTEPETTDKLTIDDVEPYKQWNEVQQQIINRYKDQGIGKKIYLTFDDGPSPYTEEIVSILDYYGVKATFFVNGREDEASLARYKIMADSGHTMALHSYSHRYDDIYASVENFERDLLKISDLVYNTTGIRSMYFRFPGGSSNTKTIMPIETFITYLNDKGYRYYDWNAACGDGTSSTVPMENIVTNVMDDAVRKNSCIALLHDAKSKRSTVDGLPLLIETLINAGFEICPIDDDTPLIQQRSVE